MLTPHAETITAWAIVALAALWISGDRIIVALAWIDRANAETDALHAADHGEPSRAQVEWELHVAEAIRLTEEDEAADAAWAALPIYAATAAHIAKHAAENIDADWAELNGGAV